MEMDMEKRTPFDPQSELQKVRRLSAKEKRLSPEQKRVTRRERLERYKELLALQEEAIAMCIRALQRSITATPDIPRVQLQEIVDDFSSKARFTKNQRELFSNTLDVFDERRKRVMTLYDTYKEKPEELFSRCFEFEPRGSITLEHTPFMLYFKTHHLEDYIAAFLYRLPEKPRDEEETPETREDAMQSGGFMQFPDGLKLPFSGIVTVKKDIGQKKKEQEPLAHQEVIEIGADEIPRLFALNQIKKIVIPKSETRGAIIISCSDTPPKHPDMIGKRLTITVADTVLFDGTLVRKDSKGTLYRSPLDQNQLNQLFEDPLFEKIYWEQTPTGTKKQKLRSEPMLHIPSESQEVSVGMVSNVLAIGNHSHQPIKAHVTRHEWVTGIPQNQVSDDGTKIHEQQHVINSLFEPTERGAESLTRIVQDVLQDADAAHLTPAQIRRQIMLGYCRSQRRLMGVDSRIRDEIIAYYSQETLASDIHNTLATSNLYRVKGRLYGKKIELLPKKFSDALAQTLRKMKKKDRERLQNIFGGNMAMRGMPTAIQRVFGKEYRRDLKRWIEAITLLRAKGYDRREVLPRLYATPVNGWMAMARRAPDRHLTAGR